MFVKLPLWGIPYLYIIYHEAWFNWIWNAFDSLDNMEEYEWAGTGTPQLQRYSN